MKKNLNFSRIKKIGWKPRIKLTRGLDLVLEKIEK
jgi:hypothetical protein